MNVNKINYINIAAMLIASCLAILVPFELVLLSYALLGPGHYLTEISWLKGRQFFTLRKYDYLLIAAVVAGCLIFKLPYANLVYYTFGLSFILLVVSSRVNRLLAFILWTGAGFFVLNHNLFYTILGIYVPTLVHVYVFTGAFMLLGAMRQKTLSGYLALSCFLLCPVLLCFLFPASHRVPSAWATGILRP